MFRASKGTAHQQRRFAQLAGNQQLVEQRAVRAEELCKKLQDTLDNSQAAVQQLKAQHEASTQSLEHRVWSAEGVCTHLQNSLAQSDEMNEHMNSQLAAMSARLRTMESRARCAPPYFDALTQFLDSECARGADRRVSSASLHAAFVDFMADAHSEAPSQTDLRALLETLGFEYGQVNIDGGNARGFRGISLSRNAQKVA